MEIECCNARPDTIGIIASRHGLDFRHEAYNHTDHRSHYKLVPDGSIHGTDPIECVSPILGNSKQGFDSLKACCVTLNEAGARVNRSTGLHVHIGGNISERQYCNVFANYYHLESVIDSFMAPSRRSGNHYCKPLHGSVTEENCHPFHDPATGIWFAHNGVLPIPSHDDMTDSEIFFREGFLNVLDSSRLGFNDPELWRYVEQVRGSSRFIFMRGDTVVKLGQWHTRNGVFYSNLNWLNS